MSGAGYASSICQSIKDEGRKINVCELPEFAEICCFLQHFGEMLGLTFTYPRIRRILTGESDADIQSLTTIIVKLLNKMHLKTQHNRWQPSLGRCLQCFAYNWEELKLIGDSLNNSVASSVFFSLPLRLRLKVVLFCLEIQFQLNASFKEKVKSLNAEVLRTPPLGFDIFGNSYWLLIDSEFNFLLYKSIVDGMKLELLGDSIDSLKSVLKDLLDEKFEKTPISDLYAAFLPCRNKVEPESPNSPNPFIFHDNSAIYYSTVSDRGAIKELTQCLAAETDSPSGQSVSKATDKIYEGKTVKPEFATSSGSNLKNNEPTEGKDCAVCPSEESVWQLEDPFKNVEGQSAKNEAVTEGSGLRRSNRKRKPVEFLKLEPFHKSTRPRLTNVGATDATPSPTKHSKKKRRRVKVVRNRRSGKSRKKKISSSRITWKQSPNGSDSDSDDEDLWADSGSNADESGVSSDSTCKRMTHDWLEDLESDIDLDAEIDSGAPLVTGRNFQRQNAQVLEEAPCQICTLSNHPEWLLLCDSCDLGFHAQCLRPALHHIPEGDWFCPKCLHARLIEALSTKIVFLKAQSAKLSSSIRMQDRLNFVNISVSNIFKEEKNQGRFGVNSVCTSDEDDRSSTSEDEEALPARSTRHKNVHYNVDAAFQQLDEVLVGDEKYAYERLKRQKAKASRNLDELDDDAMDIRGHSPILPNTQRKSEVSLPSSSDSEIFSRKKRRKRVSSGSEEFRPSDEESGSDDDGTSVEVDSKISEDLTSSYSDNSWSVCPRRRRKPKRHRRSYSGRTRLREKRSRRLLNRMESSETDGEHVSTRRSTRVHISYCELDSSEEFEGEAVLLTKCPGERVLRSSGSEYNPSGSENEEYAEKVDENDVEEVEGYENEGKSEEHTKQNALPYGSRGISNTPELAVPFVSTASDEAGNTPRMSEDNSTVRSPTMGRSSLINETSQVHDRPPENPEL